MPRYDDDDNDVVDISRGFFSKKMFRGTLNLTQENHHFIVQI